MCDVNVCVCVCERERERERAVWALGVNGRGLLATKLNKKTTFMVRKGDPWSPLWQRWELSYWDLEEV